MVFQLLPVLQAACVGTELVIRVDRCVAFTAHWHWASVYLQVVSEGLSSFYNSFSYRNDEILVLVAHLHQLSSARSSDFTSGSFSVYDVSHPFLLIPDHSLNMSVAQLVKTVIRNHVISCAGPVISSFHPACRIFINSGRVCTCFHQKCCLYNKQRY